MTHASEILPDAVPTNWVDRHAPPALRPWLKLGRFDRPTGVWLLMLPGWMGIALAGAMKQQFPDPVLLVQFLVGAALMRAAGCAYNDIVDRDFDAQVARTAMRPIPAGQISVKQAWAFTFACALVSLVILLTMNLWAVALGVASLGLVAAYPFMKRITWWPQAWLGLTFNWGALMGFAAALPLAAAPLLPPELAGEFRPFLWSGAAPGDHAVGLAWGAYLPALLLYLGGVFWTLGYDTLYALQDIEDDAMVGVKSSARRLASAVRPGVAVFYGLTVVFAAAAGLAAGLGPLFWLGLAAYAAHLARQVARINREDPALALKLFKSNRQAGFVLLVAIALGSLGL
jgi:4-hydroxybenzoate polyprenyltransferase